MTRAPIMGRSPAIGASISAATPGDVPALVALRTAVAQDMTRKFGQGPWSAAPRRTEVMRQLRASQVLVARESTGIVGTVRLVSVLPGVIDSSAFTPVDDALYVLGLAVAPQCRGRGLGRQIVEAAKDAARSRGAQALWLDVYDHEAGAGPLYLKCGFSQAGRTALGDVPLIYFEWLAAPPAGRTEALTR